MNAEYLLDAIGLLDDDLIQEAETCQVPRRRPHYRAWTALAACFAVAVVLGYGLTHLELGGANSMTSGGAAASAPTNEASDNTMPEEPAASSAPSGLDSALGNDGECLINGASEAPNSPEESGSATSSTGDSGLEAGDYCAAIMVDGILYWSTDTSFSGKVDERAVHTVTSYTNTVPEMDGQTNFSQNLSAHYAMTDLGLVVWIDQEWVLFSPTPPWES